MDSPVNRPISATDIEAAARLIHGQVERTPCAHSRTLSVATGAEIWVKFENLQYTASFKERGALNKLGSLGADERRRGVIAMSAGNHAQGVAYHAGRLGIPATIVMPSFTPNVKVRHTRNFGARVILHGETLSEASAEARRLAEAEKLVFVHPYDDPLIMAGQGTIGFEMLDDVPELDTIVVPVGGGGLISGIAVAAKARNPDVRIIGVETSGYAALFQVLHGAPVNVGGETIAEGIAVRDTGKLAIDICSTLVSEVLLVEEVEIETAIQMMLEIEKTVVEGAGAAGLAAVLVHREKFVGRKVGIVLTGGNIDTRLLASILMRGLVRDGRIARLRVKISDRPGQLAVVSQLIASTGANIIEVQHQRLFGGVAAKSAELDVVMETRDRAHVAEAIAALQGGNYKVKLLEGAADQ